MCKNGRINAPDGVCGKLIGPSCGLSQGLAQEDAVRCGLELPIELARSKMCTESSTRGLTSLGMADGRSRGIPDEGLTPFTGEFESE